MLNRYTPVLAAIVALLISNSSYAATVVTEYNLESERIEFSKLNNAMLFAGFSTAGTTEKQKQDFGTEQPDSEITTVPLPAAAWLFISGILGLVTVSRRKKEHGKN